MLKQRIITALILAAGLLAVLFALPSGLAVLVWGLIIVLGAWEWAAFGDVRAGVGRAAYAAGIGLLLWLVWHLGGAPGAGADHAVNALASAVPGAGDATNALPDTMAGGASGTALRIRLGLYAAACAWWALAFLWLSLAPGFRRPALVLACGVPALVPCFMAIADVHTGAGTLRGPWVVLWLLAWIFSADIGAYFAGRAFGRLKLAPRISPGKTWEGAIGGVLLAMLVGAAGAAAFEVPVWPAVCFGIALAALSIVGDLTESLFKRGAGLKDSGGLLPGHGGVLDRIDSVTAAAPLFALALYAYEGWR